MKYLKPFILESKNLGELYHVLSYDKLLYVLENNKISSYKAGNSKISLTRNKMLNSYLGDGPQAIFKLVINGSKLSNNYKIRPFAYKSHSNMRFNEYEEQVNTKEIDNVFSYIEKVVLIKSRVEGLMYLPWGENENELSDYFTNIRRKENTLPFMIKNIISKLKKYGKDLYVQEGNVIKKDDKYINYLINYPLKEIETKKIILYRGRKKKKRRFSYDDILVDIKGEEVMSNLVVGGNLDVKLENMEYLDYEPNMEISNLNFKQYSDDEFEPYIINVRKLDGGEWKIDNIRPLN